MTHHAPRYLTDADYQELVQIWRTIKALQTLRDHSLPKDGPGSWMREAAEEALDLEYQRLNRLYAETHPTIPGVDG